MILSMNRIFMTIFAADDGAASFSKSSRVVGEVMGNYHPHGDAAIYDALARLVQWWSLRYVR